MASKMNLSKKIITLFVALIPYFAYSQGKYFEAVCEKGSFGDSYFGLVKPLNNQPYVVLTYNKTKQELFKLLQAYLKTRPGLKLEHLETGEGAMMAYRDFATVGNKLKCFADLTAMSIIYLIPENGKIEVSLGPSSKIFSTIFDAKLKISPDNIVASDNDVPFNEYQLVQPADESVLTSSVWLGTRSKKRDLKQAYPDSVFDPSGKITNMNNKKTIEAYYDGYVTDLKSYIDAKIK